MECLTKQNNDLEEQLRQKNAGHNTQKEDQEGTRVERRDQEGLEGSNAPSRLERQVTSRPSVTDTAPPHMVAEMQMMKKRIDFVMNTLKGRVSSDLNDLVQLRQKNAGHNTQEEDQEGTNVERRDQEGPEGSNAPSRLERQDTSHPSVTDTAPPHMVAEMQMMKEWMDFMMNTLRG